jgi:levansucrase
MSTPQLSHSDRFRAGGSSGTSSPPPDGLGPSRARPRRTQHSLLAGLTALALVVAACGAEDASTPEPAADSPAPTPATTPAEGEGGTDTTGQEPAAESPDGAATPEVAGTPTPETGGQGGDLPDDDRVPAEFAGIPRWTPEQAQTIELRPELVAPLIDRDQVEAVMPGYWVWDWWAVRDRDNNLARIDGWYMMIALTAPDDLLPGQRHDQAEHRYAVSRDGSLWQDAGPIYPDGTTLGSRQWAGSAVYDTETGLLTTYYTAAGRGPGEPEPEGAGPGSTTSPSPDPGTGSDGTATPAPGESPLPAGNGDNDEGISYEQRMVAAQARVIATDHGVRFADWTDHRVVLEATGDLYMSTLDTEGGAGQIDAFRDPWYFRDAADGAEYLLFTATLPESSCEADGVVGVARATGDDMMSWELDEPMLVAPCVNDELERPHILVHDGQYYLFFTTHSHTFDPGLVGEDPAPGPSPAVSPAPSPSPAQDEGAGGTGGTAESPAATPIPDATGLDVENYPEGLYGFVANELFGDYRPLNGSGLVLANPVEEPYQAYSWMVLPTGWIQSFVQYVDLGGLTIQEVGDEADEFQMERFVGQPAPAVRVEIDGDRTRLTDETYDYGEAFLD